MKSYAIVIKDDETSEYGFDRLKYSSKNVGNTFEIERFNAVIPGNVDSIISEENVHWNWPHRGTELDIQSGIKKMGYGGKDPKRRKACGMSHYLLWKQSAQTDTPILILEHDAIFETQLDATVLLQSGFEVVGINDPRGATRLASKFHTMVQTADREILPVPEIDKPEIAQGLAGNSAYLIKPEGAKMLLELVSKFGMWNNDAIMCKQLMPDMLGVTKVYYTKTQALPSTTMN